MSFDPTTISQQQEFVSASSQKCIYARPFTRPSKVVRPIHVRVSNHVLLTILKSGYVLNDIVDPYLPELDYTFYLCYVNLRIITL